MKAVFFNVLLIVGLAASKDFCSEELRSKVDRADELKNGTLMTRDGELYPKGTFWKDDAGLWWTCPCLLGPCIRICDKDYAEDALEAEKHLGVFTPITWNKNHNTTPIESFKLVHDVKCQHNAWVLMQSHEFKILPNGKLELFGEDEFYSEHFCIHRKDGDLVHLLICLESELEEMELSHPTDFRIDSYVAIASTIFLILTAVAYALSPEIRSVFGKGVVCYSACLALHFFSDNSILFLVDRIDNKVLCFSHAYVGLYFFLASEFWLNSLCFDVFLTLKGSASNQAKYFTRFAVYSFGSPMFIVGVAMILNTALEHSHMTCWYTGANSSWLYNIGPRIILLVADLILMVKSYMIQARALVSGETEAGATEQQKKERRGACLKLVLFTVVGWLLFPVYFLSRIWLFVWLIECARGLFIFLLLVCFDKQMRMNLTDRLCARSEATEPTVQFQPIVEDSNLP